MLHAGIEALFGRNRDGHRTKHIFNLRRRNQNHKNINDDLARYFSDKPHLEKTLIYGTTFAFCAVQGWRSTMEDKNKHLIPLDNYSWKLWSFFAIFDGHNGRQKIFYYQKKTPIFSFKGIATAKNASEQLDTYLLKALNQMLSKQHNSTITSGAPVCSSQLDLNQLHNAIKQAYFELDKDLKKIVKDDSGCVCVSIKNSHFLKKEISNIFRYHVLLVQKQYI